jgi:hypothetical protein
LGRVGCAERQASQGATQASQGAAKASQGAKAAGSTDAPSESFDEVTANARAAERNAAVNIRV